MVENLKSEGWQFLQLAGSYQQAPNYQEAYPAFSTRVELIIKRDVEIFTAEVFKDTESISEKPKPASGHTDYDAPFPSDDPHDPSAGYEEIALAMAEEGLEFPDPEIPLPPPLSPTSSSGNGGSKQPLEPINKRKPNPDSSTSRAPSDSLVGAVPPVRITPPSMAASPDTKIRPDNPDSRS